MISKHRGMCRFASSFCRALPVSCLLLPLILLACPFSTPPAAAQFFERSTVLPPAEVEQLDSASAAHLENARRFLTQRQWAEAVEAIRRVQEADSGRLTKVGLAQPLEGFERYVTAAEYCQWRLAALAAEAPEALEHYRGLVDPLAESWYREWAERNDADSLQRVVERAFASRWGDDALLKLGDLALARGEPAAARALWERIDPRLSVPPSAAAALRSPAGSPLWLALRRFDFANHGAELAAVLQRPSAAPPGAFPDTDLELAAVRARLVLASILEGSLERAGVELNLLRLLAPQAEGQLAGRRGRYADLLASLLEEAAAWPVPQQSSDWPTFGGNAARGKTAPTAFDPAGQPLWTYPLPRLESDRESIGAGRLRVAEDGKALLSYHPIVAGDQVLLRLDARGRSFVVALDLKTGQELWKVDYSRGLTAAPAADADDAAQRPEVSDAHADLARHVGVARYTLSLGDGKLMARMGSPVTIPAARRAALWLAKDQGYLLGLDLATQGKPLEGFPLVPPGREWTFEGPPLIDGSLIYTAMRRVEGARTQLYLAAFERQTTPFAVPAGAAGEERPAGRLRWQTRICSSATLGGGEIDQLTHLLLTLDAGRLYLNTNAGAVAAVSAADGRLLWLVKYPRADFGSGRSDKRQQHLFRDLVPCLAYKDLVIVAPTDCERIFALHAASGELAWSLPPGAADDVVHLLGAAEDTIIGSGERLYWIDANSGRILTQYPAGPLVSASQAAPSPRGFGRGLIVGTAGVPSQQVAGTLRVPSDATRNLPAISGEVWWPTREVIYVFDARPAATDFGWQPRLLRQIPLVPRGATGGNLVLADGILLIATGDNLIAYGE